MFAKALIPFLYAVSIFSILAIATPCDVGGGGGGGGGGGTLSQCNTGDAQCCNTVEAADEPDAREALDLVGVIVDDPTTLVGLGCTPISVTGVGEGANCAQQPVCCENNDFNGFINIDCTPISL